MLKRWWVHQRPTVKPFINLLLNLGFGFVQRPSLLYGVENGSHYAVKSKQTINGEPGTEDAKMAGGLQLELVVRKRLELLLAGVKRQFGEHRIDH